MSDNKLRWEMVLVKHNDEGPSPSLTVRGQTGGTEWDLIDEVQNFFRSNATEEVSFSLMDSRSAGRIVVERRERWFAQKHLQSGGVWMKIPAIIGIWDTLQCCIICGRCDGCNC